MLTQNNTEVAVEDFAMALGLLVRRIRADAPAEFQEFSWTQQAVLRRLEKNGPTTSADLARGRMDDQNARAAVEEAILDFAAKLPPDQRAAFGKGLIRAGRARWIASQLRW